MAARERSRAWTSAMTEFDYLSVLISIVLGLGLSHVMATAAQLVRFRAAVKFYTPALLWLALLFFLHVQIWWAVFELRDVPEWTFGNFVLVLAIPAVVYVISVLLSPDFDREERIDLRASYFAHRRWFFGLLALLPILSLAQEYAISGHIQLDPDPLFRLAFLALALVGLGSANERLHRVLAIVTIVIFATYVGMLFLELS